MRFSKRIALSFALSVSLLLFVITPVQAAAKTCADVLTPMKDTFALQIENGNTVHWTNTTKELQSARDLFLTKIKAKKWSYEFNSAYRPVEYQRHLYEIVNNQPLCSAEKAKHDLGTLVAAPSATAPHVRGIAFDANIVDENGKALNGFKFVDSRLVAVAKEAGLFFPDPTTDGVHHQLINNPGTGSGSVLQLGDQGAAVTTLQMNLNRVGYSIAVDGVFGAGTESAVKNFQSAHALAVDGKAGPATSSKISTLATTTTTLKNGSSGDEVKVLQRLLSKKGYTVSADGIFGSGTVSAVKNYQSANGLTSDGIVGSATWNKLRS